MFSRPKTPPPPAPPPPPPNPPTMADASMKPPSTLNPIGGLASTILTSPFGVLGPATTGRKTLLGG